MILRCTSAALSALAVIMATGCGGSSNGGPQAALTLGTATWVVLDLDTREFRYLAEVPGANADPEYGRTLMAFRRVRTSGGDIFVAMYEMTQGQWSRIAAAAPSSPWLDVDTAVCSSDAHGENRPAYNVTHTEALARLTSFTLTNGARLDLPTADEWTAACGTTVGWWWGTTADSDDLARNAVVHESVVTIDRLAVGNGMDTGGPLDVGSKAPNRWGLYDILGNVWEWTREGTDVRGGSWYDGAQTCRSEVKAGASSGITGTVDHVLIGARPVFRP